MRWKLFLPLGAVTGIMAACGLQGLADYEVGADLAGQDAGVNNGASGTSGAGGGGASGVSGTSGTSGTSGVAGAAGAAGSTSGSSGSGGSTPDAICTGLDATTKYNVGQSEPCDQKEDGTPLEYGVGPAPQGGDAGVDAGEDAGTMNLPPTGICQRGSRECLPSGSWGACKGGIGRKDRDVTSTLDNDCDGAIDKTEGTGCVTADGNQAALGATKSCFEGADGSGFPATAHPGSGTCVTGTETCEATADKQALRWGTCVGAVGPTGTTDTCNTTGADENCNGTANEGCPCLSGATQPCGSCGGMQACASGVWGTCSVSTPTNYAQSCGSCGGFFQCDGTCSVPTPANLNAACGTCNNGAINCSGGCDGSHTNYNATACGTCNNGTTDVCSGSCVGSHANYNATACGTCNNGATDVCSGACVGSHANYNATSCGACNNGTTNICSGSCDGSSTPGNYGQSCGSYCGGGSILCSGSCSASCDFTYAPNGTTDVGYGSCNAVKTGDTPAITCPAGTSAVYCDGHITNISDQPSDQGDGTSRYYTGLGDVDPQWNGSACFVHVRAFNCNAFSVYPVLTCHQ